MLGLVPSIQGRETEAMACYVYIMASRRNGTLYVGVTNDLVRRVYEHRESVADGFTKRHGVKLLVYFEIFDAIEPAIQREKTMKRWPRVWKLNQIERDNPQCAISGTTYADEAAFPVTLGTSPRVTG